MKFVNLLMKLIFFISLYLHYVSAIDEVHEDIEDTSRCSGPDWVQFGETKCFKLVKTYYTGTESLSACEKEFPFSNSAVITSQDEQNFLTNYIFNELSTTVNIWFGLTWKDGEITWVDGTRLTFTNWAEGSPTNESRKNCFEMALNFDKVADEEWKEASCDKSNYVICEKLQLMSVPELQKNFIMLKTQSTWKIEQLKNEIEDLKKTTELEIKNLKANPVPIGFVYVQLYDQPSPSETWPEVTWTEISSTYEGLFFRVVGGNSSAFGEIQDSDSPKLTDVQISSGFDSTKIIITQGEWSKSVLTGSTASPSRSLSFLVSDSETRPVNTAMRIWKRTA